MPSHSHSKQIAWGRMKVWIPQIAPMDWLSLYLITWASAAAMATKIYFFL